MGQVGQDSPCLYVKSCQVLPRKNIGGVTLKIIASNTTTMALASKFVYGLMEFENVSGL